MKCPICNIDLSPLDLASRTEHVDLCIENGPSVVELDDFGRPTVKRNIPLAKQRKICPICDKTFTGIFAHFKTCAIKHDVPPHLMLEHWDSLNKEAKNLKPFPCEMFDSFVAKCIKENRIGDQVDIARALSLSMGKKDPLEECSKQPIKLKTATVSDEIVEGTNESSNSQTNSKDAVQTIMENAIQQASTSKQVTTKKTKVMPKTRLQTTEADTKRSNILLRVERELSVTRSRRYRETLQLANVTEIHSDEEECMIVPQLILPPTQNPDTKEALSNPLVCNTLFYRSRMKNCDSSETCLNASCENHELNLLMDEFQPYSGTSMCPLVKEMRSEMMFAGSSSNDQQSSSSSQTLELHNEKEQE